MNTQSKLQTKLYLLRVAVWGQALGMLLFNIFLMVEDAPYIFDRVGPWQSILIILALGLINVKKPSVFVARVLPSFLLAFLVLTVSISSTVIVLAGTLQAYRLPAFLVTPEWQYTRTTFLISLLVFSSALVMNLVFVIRVFRAKENG